MYLRRFRQVQGKLRGLQEERRQIGAAMRDEGCSYREIGQVLGIAHSYARDLVVDPEASARRARGRIVEARAQEAASSEPSSG